MPSSDDGVTSHMNDQKDQVVNALVEASEGLRHVAGLAERLSVVLDKLDFTQSSEAQAKQYLDLIAATRVLAHIKSDPTAGATTTAEKRKLKDPTAPKRPPTAYLLFQNAMRAKTKQENPQMGMREVMTHIAAAWGTLSEKDKKPYVEAQDKAKVQYVKDLATWSEKNGDVDALSTPVAKPSKAVKDKANATKPKAAVSAPVKSIVPTPPQVVTSTPKSQGNEIITDTDDVSMEGSGGEDSEEESEDEEDSDEESSEDELEPQPPKKKAKITSTKPGGKIEKSSKKK